jgi:Tfp pilus assembly protein PilZ
MPRRLTFATISPLFLVRSSMPRPPSEQRDPLGGRADTPRAHRFALDVPVQVGDGRSWCAGVAKDIGPGGIFVATVRPLNVGTTVTVKLIARADAAPIEALAEVRWCRPLVGLTDLPAGAGLRFMDTVVRNAILATELRLSRLSGPER